ncbi:hypothetical protein AAG570_006376 [Ranatra chinensis]|uniref:Uncharacterized protein n=1 Tax=Ranatra chinensis TaxID=642074 RepID=A0ABD0Z4E6_9HEMI
MIRGRNMKACLVKLKFQVNCATMNFYTSLMLMMLAAGVAKSYVIPQYLSIDGEYLVPYGELESHLDEKGDRLKEISISVLVWAPAVLDLLDWGMTIKSGKEGVENLYTLEEHTWAILAMENHATILASEALSSSEMDPNFINSLSIILLQRTTFYSGSLEDGAFSSEKELEYQTPGAIFCHADQYVLQEED